MGEDDEANYTIFYTDMPANNAKVIIKASKDREKGNDVIFYDSKTRYQRATVLEDLPKLNLVSYHSVPNDLYYAAFKMLLGQ